MTERSWSPRFEVVLRQYLPLLAEGEALHPEAWLTDLGLDSLGVVGLLAELADEFGAGPDLDTLDPALFANPRHAVGGGPTGGSGRRVAGAAGRAGPAGVGPQRRPALRPARPGQRRAGAGPADPAPGDYAGLAFSAAAGRRWRGRGLPVEGTATVPVQHS